MNSYNFTTVINTVIAVNPSVQWRRGGGDEGQGLRGDRDGQALRYPGANCVH